MGSFILFFSIGFIALIFGMILFYYLKKRFGQTLIKIGAFLIVISGFIFLIAGEEYIMAIICLLFGYVIRMRNKTH